MGAGDDCGDVRSILLCAARDVNALGGEDEGKVREGGAPALLALAASRRARSADEGAKSSTLSLRASLLSLLRLELSSSASVYATALAAARRVGRDMAHTQHHVRREKN